MVIIKDPNDMITMDVKRIKNDILIIHFKGTIDTYNTPFFSTQVNKLIDKGYKKIIFDFRELIYMSSTGVGGVINIFKTLKSKDGKLVLLDVMPKVFEVFQLLGMTVFLNFADSLRSAVSSFQEVKEKATFPIIFNCLMCNKRLKANKPGRFKCSCGGILVVDDLGKVMLG